MKTWICCKCNMPVSQPCCKLETAKLKEGVKPEWCVLINAEADWKLDNNTPDQIQSAKSSQGGEDMREIKFRARDDKENKYYYGVPVNKNGKYSHCTSEGFARQYDPSYVSLDVEQFTGLHDKNGKEIYENDIIECNAPHLGIWPRSNPPYIYQVEWDENGGWFPFADNCDYEPYPYPSECEVIGNVHENPELLKTKEE